MSRNWTTCCIAVIFAVLGGIAKAQVIADRNLHEAAENGPEPFKKILEPIPRPAAPKPKNSILITKPSVPKPWDASMSPSGSRTIPSVSPKSVREFGWVELSGVKIDLENIGLPKKSWAQPDRKAVSAPQRVLARVPSASKVVEGTDANIAIANGIMGNAPMDPYAGRVVALLGTQSTDAMSAKDKALLETQRKCDSSLKGANTTFAQWRKQLPPNYEGPKTLEEFPAWHRLYSTTDSERAIAMNVSEAFAKSVKACFDDAPPNIRFGALESRIGALRFGQRERNCSGFALNATRVMTAQHCVSHRYTATSGMTFTRFTDDEVRQLRFQLNDLHGTAGADQHFTEYEVEGYAMPDNPRGAEILADDWIVLKVATMQISDLQVATDPHQILPGARVVVAGLMYWADDTRKPFRARYSKGLTCMVATAINNCIVHTCSTLPGMSGAPIFFEAGEKWYFGGVHSRAMGAADYLSPNCTSEVMKKLIASQVNGGINATLVLK